MSMFRYSKSMIHFSGCRTSKLHYMPPSLFTLQRNCNWSCLYKRIISSCMWTTKHERMSLQQNCKKAKIRFLPIYIGRDIKICIWVNLGTESINQELGNSDISDNCSDNFCDNSGSSDISNSRNRQEYRNIENIGNTGISQILDTYGHRTMYRTLEWYCNFWKWPPILTTSQIYQPNYIPWTHIQNGDTPQASNES